MHSTIEVTKSRNSDAEVLRKIHLIVDRGNNVEIKKSKDGELKVFEVKKNIVAM